MKLRTLIPVTYNDGIKSQTSGIVTMELGSVAYSNNFTTIGVNFTYFKEDNSPLLQNAFFINGEEDINNLFQLIESSLPEFTDEVSYTRNKFYTGAILKMAETFEILPSQIEIIE